MHERSITREVEPGELSPEAREFGRYLNAYGPGNQTGAPVGLPLPMGAEWYQRESYTGLEPAVMAAEQRSGGIRPQVRGPVAPAGLNNPLSTEVAASRLNLPTYSLSPTRDVTPLGQYKAGERGEPSQDAVKLSTEDYLKLYPDAVSARVARDRDPGNVALRNAEHYRVAQELAGTLTPVGAGAATVGYSALKALSQGFPSTAGVLFKLLMGKEAPQTTTEPGAELAWGLRGSLGKGPFSR